MRNKIKLALLGIAAVAAAPALAQVGVGVGANARVGANTGGVLDSTRGTLDRTVDRVDRQVNRALSSDARLVTRAEVRGGAVVRDGRGRRIGTVHHVEHDTAIVAQGNRRLRVPLSALYRSGGRLVTTLSRAQLAASADASASAHARH
jgi:hypothetical protein